MAKKWIPSQKQLSIYDELLKRQNQVRKLILKRRRADEEEGLGRPLPDLIIPMKAKRSRSKTYFFDSYADYRRKMKDLQRLYGGKGSPLIQYYKEAYKRNILSIVKDWIDVYLNFTEKPQGYFGKYSDEQIYIANQISDDGGRYLDLYNKFISLRTEEFITMYNSGMIPKLKFIYDEMKGTTTEDLKNGTRFEQIDEFINNYKEYKRQVREQTRNVMIKSVEDTPNFIESYSERIKNRSDKRRAEMISEAKRRK